MRAYPALPTRPPSIPREHMEQVRLIAAVRVGAHDVPELGLLYAIPNGGRRAMKTARWIRAEGGQAGVPDLCLPVARGVWHGMYVEMKAGKGRETAEQKLWRARLTEQGYYAIVSHSAEAALRSMLVYLDVETALHLRIMGQLVGVDPLADVSAG